MNIVFASSNQNKVNEIQHLLPKDIKLLSLKDINCFDDIPETATTIKENASLKAHYIHNKYKINCFADDTGLEVEALNGAPGVYSARFAGEHKNDLDNINKLLLLLKHKNNRIAQFKTVISLIYNNNEYFFKGIIKGVILNELKGSNGFGYDPIFAPTLSSNKIISFAEMNLEEKNLISHRSIAVNKLINFLTHDVK